MEIKATIEQMSAPITYKFKTESGVERESSYLEVVLNDGLNSYYCETASPLNAQETATKWWLWPGLRPSSANVRMVVLSIRTA